MIELVIKIAEEEYSNIEPFLNGETIKGGFNLFKMLEIIKNGILLPKGHGDLIDRDKLVYDCSLGDGGCDHICRCDGCSYNIIRETTINKATPIIEADKAESEV